MTAERDGEVREVSKEAACAGGCADDAESSGINERRETRNDGAAVMREHEVKRPSMRSWRFRRASWMVIAATLGLGAGVCHADGLTDKVVRALRVAGPEIGVTVVTDNELKIGWKALRAQ